MQQQVSAEQLLRDALAAFDERDLDGFLATMDPDVEAYTLLSELSGTPYRGHAGLRRWWEEALGEWDYGDLQVERVLAGDDTGVALISLTGRGRASDVNIELELALLFRLRDDKCVYFRMYGDREAALADSGLSP